MSGQEVLYLDGKPFGVVDGLRFVSESDGIEQWEMGVEPVDNLLAQAEAEAEEAFNLEHAECTWTAPEPQSVVLNIYEAGPMLWWLWATSSNIERALLFDSKQIGSPPKRPPNPERPMWAINPGRTRRNAFGPSRRVK